MTELDVRKAFVKVETEDQVYYGVVSVSTDEDFILLGNAVVTSPAQNYLGTVLLPKKRIMIIYKDVRHQLTRMRIAELLNGEGVDIDV